MSKSEGRAAQTVEVGGRIPGLEGSVAYTLKSECGDSLPILLSVPHDGQCYPDALLANMRAPAVSGMRLEDRHISLIADRIADETNLSLLKAHAPRAMIDLNRSVDDIDWGMVTGVKAAASHHSRATFRARNGLGLIPRRISGVGELWRRPIAHAEIAQRIEHIHAPYHKAIWTELERLRDLHGIALLFDLHSMPPLKPARPGHDAAEFVLGDRFGASCDSGIADLALRYIGGKGRRVAYNRPYSGGFILDRYGQPRRGIHALQLEVCRSLYLDARLDQPTARLPSTARLVAGLVRCLGEQVLAMAPGRLAQAAE